MRDAIRIIYVISTLRARIINKAEDIGDYWQIQATEQQLRLQLRRENTVGNTGGASIDVPFRV